jgi:hypothetical protein
MPVPQCCNADQNDTRLQVHGAVQAVGLGFQQPVRWGGCHVVATAAASNKSAPANPACERVRVGVMDFAQSPSSGEVGAGPSKISLGDVSRSAMGLAG